MAAGYALYCFVVSLAVKTFLEKEMFKTGILCLGIEFVGMVGAGVVYYYIKIKYQWMM